MIAHNELGQLALLGESAEEHRQKDTAKAIEQGQGHKEEGADELEGRESTEYRRDQSKGKRTKEKFEKKTQNEH